jgi:hypothetical protein
LAVVRIGRRREVVKTFRAEAFDLARDARLELFRDVIEVALLDTELPLIIKLPVTV